jgi:hypothetical protein
MPEIQNGKRGKKKEGSLDAKMDHTLYKLQYLRQAQIE